jgi:hypothetical protein
VRGIRTVPSLIDYDEIPESGERLSWFKSLCDKVLGNWRKLIDTTPYRFRQLQLVATEDGHLKIILRRVESPNLIWVRWNNCPSACLPSWIPTKNMRVLQVVGNKLKTLWQEESQVKAGSLFFLCLFYGRLLLLLIYQHTVSNAFDGLDGSDHIFIFLIVER